MIKTPVASTTSIFKTQGTAYELNASRIGAIEVFITSTASNELATPVLPQQQQQQQPERGEPQTQLVHPPPHRSMLLRKSTLYQETPLSAYTKYGNSDDEDPTTPTPTVNFEDVKLKQAMASMTASLNVNVSVAPVGCMALGGKGVPKKRFPSPATSSTTSQLFWCAYIACKGDAAFDMISNAFVSETEFKYETVELLRGMRLLVKPLFKKHKLSLPNFEAELISSKRTTLQVMTGILICHQKNLLYIDHRMFIEIKASDHADGFVVIEKIKNRYCVYTDPDSTELDRCRAELLRMESLDSPVRSASYYKLGELEDMCKRLALVLPATGTKKADLYSEILKYIENSGIRV
jgi:hypothetical protein